MIGPCLNSHSEVGGGLTEDKTLGCQVEGDAGIVQTAQKSFKSWMSQIQSRVAPVNSPYSYLEAQGACSKPAL